MYKFAICDDDIEDLKIIYTLFKEFLHDFKIYDYVIDVYKSGYKLLESVSKYDLILLDIQLVDIDGISIARKFIDNNEEQNIIFISSSNAYLKEGYRVRALRYITKPIDKEELFYDLKNVLKKIIEDDLFVFDELQTGLKLYYRNIEYIEVVGRSTYIYYKGSKRSSKKQLKKWEELLSQNHFVRSHNSFLVNLKHVYYIKNNQVILKSGGTIPLSRTYKDKFKSLLFDYLGDIE
ncbi:LytR/AlgR family response regulator transcription factor [[Eubacterium] hominis]|uniref:LytR/AlgR family response regulator transcription factor n=1 Tax=[Eubacterium] hominis TaxID=2764325 RepID=UPI003A4D52C6